REVIVVLLGFLYPYDVIEQEAMAVARSQPLMSERWLADHDGAQLADFRMNAEFTHDVPPSVTINAASLELPCAGARARQWLPPCPPHLAGHRCSVRSPGQHQY